MRGIFMRRTMDHKCTVKHETFEFHDLFMFLIIHLRKKVPGDLKVSWRGRGSPERPGAGAEPRWSRPHKFDGFRPRTGEVLAPLHEFESRITLDGLDPILF